jgi:lysyl-tRNA synthetase, class II
MGSRLDRVTEERLKTIEGLRARGIDPYPHTYRPSHTAAGARVLCEREGERTRPVSVGGRIIAKRKMGKMAFLDLRDGSGKLQASLRRDLL